MQPLVDGGKAITLMAGSVIAPSGEIVRDPNFAEVPTDVVDAYRAAFEKVITNPEFRAAIEKALGGYALCTGTDAQALWGTVTGMSPEARAWLADWYAEKVSFKLAQ